MSVVTLFNYYQRPKKMIPLFNILNQIRTGKYRYLIERLRYCREHDSGDEYNYLSQVIPTFSVAGNFVLRNEKLEMVSYSGNLYLEIPYMNERDLKDVKALLRKDPFVMACFENALKCGLVILVNGSGAPENHYTSFKLAVKYYEKLTGAKVFDLSGMRAAATCMVSMDDDIYISIGGRSITEIIG